MVSPTAHLTSPMELDMPIVFHVRYKPHYKEEHPTVFILPFSYVKFQESGWLVKHFNPLNMRSQYFPQRIKFKYMIPLNLQRSDHL
jgi:hypothetical protein